MEAGGQSEAGHSGGHAGGYQGNSANGSGWVSSGGSQTGPGSNVDPGFTSAAGFGYGGTAPNGSSESGTYGGGGGGSGWFGGGAGSFSYGKNNTASGAGGSGYVGNSRLSNAYMYGYSVAQTSTAGMVTYSTGNASGSAISNYAKAGHGYAQVQYLSYAYLANLTVNGQNIGFSPTTLTYNVVVDKSVGEIQFDATKGANYQTVTSSTDFLMTSEVNTKYIKVTAADGTEVTYTINISWNDITYPYLSDLKLNGTSIAGFEPTKLNYVIPVANSITSVTLQGVKGAAYQEITYPDDLNLTGTVTRKEIKVKALDGTEVTYTLDIEYIDPRLKSIDITNGTITQTFSPDRYQYNVVALPDYDWIDISATPIASLTTTEGTGRYTIPVGTTDITIKGIDCRKDQSANYVLHVTRLGSSYPYLDDIKVDGVTVDGFDPETLYYEIPVAIDKKDFTLDVTKGRVSQETYLPNSLAINSGENRKEIVVVSEDKTKTTTYVLNFVKEHSSKLKTLKFGNYDFTIPYSPTTYNYYLEIPHEVLSLQANYEAYDEEANVKIKGNGYIKNSSSIIVTVDEPNTETTTYKIVVLKETVADSEVATNFKYTGGVQTFKAPYTGTYRLETWGAQGGGNGGFGGYSRGEVYLNKDDILYIVVGGQGGRAGGGYNGGGRGQLQAGSVNPAGWGGGGATHIATTNRGLLSNYNSYRNELLIVSGAGGGASEPGHQGGSGGGQAGNRGTGAYWIPYGGTQSGPSANIDPGYTSNAGFGYGGNGPSGTNVGGTWGGGGGGAGYYGGGAGSYSTGKNNTASGGGGSGYIGNPLLTNKVMYGYRVSETSNASSKTVSTTAYSSNAVPYYAKAGNGAASITYVPAKSSDNFLKSLKCNVEGLPRNFEEEFDPAVQQYTLKINEEKSVKLSGQPSDETATINGFGEYIIKEKETIIPIVVTAEDGSQRTYNVKVLRRGSAESRANNITINGLIEEYCREKEEYGILKIEEDGELIDATFDPDTNTYYMTIPFQIKQLSFVVEPMNEDAIIEGAGNKALLQEHNTVVIHITSESEENETTYTYNITRDMSGDNYLKTLEVYNAIEDLEFDPEKTEYRFSIPNTDDELDLFVETDDEEATYEVIGNENLEEGDNEVQIVVTARNGNTKTYVLNVYKEKTSNVYLRTLEVNDGDEIVYNLTPEFDKLTWNYKVIVPNDVINVNIDAEAQNPNTFVRGTGEVELQVGKNVFSVIVIAMDGCEETYTITITREKNSNANLSSLKVFDLKDREYALSSDFDSNTLEYFCNYACNHTQVNIVGVPEVSTTIVKLLDGDDVKKRK